MGNLEKSKTWRIKSRDSLKSRRREEEMSFRRSKMRKGEKYWRKSNRKKKSLEKFKKWNANKRYSLKNRKKEKEMKFKRSKKMKGETYRKVQEEQYKAEKKKAQEAFEAKKIADEQKR